MAKQVSDYKLQVILSAFLAPVVGGAIIYYSLKKTHADMAKLGNNMSFLAFVIWIAAFLVVFPKVGITIPDFLPGVVGLAGLVLSIITVINIKKHQAQ